MRRFRILPLLLAALLCGAGWWFRVPVSQWWARNLAAIPITEQRDIPDAETYAVLSKEMERWRVDLAEKYSQAKTPAERGQVEHDARVILEQALPAMMRCWLGTPWDFNGTAPGPGEGKIACGYFVATVLKDAGFRVDRYRLAQQPSENILRTFLAKDSCVLTVGTNYENFTRELEGVEPGIYVLGLDTHVAFLLVDEKGLRFIHSSGSRPWCVVDQGRNEAEVVRKSSWRMLGNLTANPAVLRRWLKGDKIPVRGG